MNTFSLRFVAALALAAIIFSIYISGYDLWPPDEPRYALIAREMMDSGDYLLPHVNNQPYKEKPPLLFWLIAAASSVTGEVTPLSARIPSVISGLVVLFFTGLLARELFNARVALWAVLILMTMQRFWWNARFGQIDMLLTACLSAGLYSFWRWESSRRFGWLVLFFGAALAGLYAKGPGVMVFPVLFVLVWTWKSEQRRVAWFYLGIGCICCIAAYAAWVIPAHIAFANEARETAGNALASNLFRQTIGRFFLGVSHANWPWYYLTTLPVDWLPWTLFLPWVLVWVWKQRKESVSVRFLLCWSMPAFLFFSIAIGKRAVYLLPLFPAFAILFAAAVLDFMETGSVKWKRRIGRVYAFVLVVAGIGLLGAVLYSYKQFWTPGVISLGLLIALYGIMIFYRSWKSDMNSLHIHIFWSFALVTLFCSILVFPVVNIYKSAKYFCAPVAEISGQGTDFDLYSVGFAREEYVFYSRHFMKELYTEAVPLESTHGMDMMKLLKFQKEFSRAIVKAVEKVSIKDIASITADELAQLTAALQVTVNEKKYPRELMEDFERGLTRESDAFFNVFGSEKPAYLYVQEYDWRWIYAVHPDIQGAAVISRDAVGSRDVLLVANPAGAALLNGTL